MPLKAIYCLPLSALGLFGCLIAGFPQRSLSQSTLAQFATPRLTVTAAPASPSGSTPTPTPTGTPSCLDDRQASVAISGVLTREQTRQSLALLKQGKTSREVLRALNLSVEQRRELRKIGRQKCKK